MSSSNNMAMFLPIWMMLMVFVILDDDDPKPNGKVYAWKSENQVVSTIAETDVKTSNINSIIYFDLNGRSSLEAVADQAIYYTITTTDAFCFSTDNCTDVLYLTTDEYLGLDNLEIQAVHGKPFTVIDDNQVVRNE